MVRPAGPVFWFGHWGRSGGLRGTKDDLNDGENNMSTLNRRGSCHGPCVRNARANSGRGLPDATLFM